MLISDRIFVDIAAEKHTQTNSPRRIRPTAFCPHSDRTLITFFAQLSVAGGCRSGSGCDYETASGIVLAIIGHHGQRYRGGVGFASRSATEHVMEMVWLRLWGNLLDAVDTIIAA